MDRTQERGNVESGHIFSSDKGERNHLDTGRQMEDLTLKLYLKDMEGSTAQRPLQWLF